MIVDGSVVDKGETRESGIELERSATQGGYQKKTIQSRWGYGKDQRRLKCCLREIIESEKSARGDDSYKSTSMVTKGKGSIVQESRQV